MNLDTILIVVVAIGAAAGAFSFFRNPGSYISLGKVLFTELLPIIMKRKSPEDEKKWRDASRRGEEWDELNNRPKTRNK